ncbi:MAG: 5-formyltetrahydrofolate cyclo-ligase [Nocardioides sp.]
MDSSQPSRPHGQKSAQKTALRDRLVTIRNRRSLTEIGESARALAEVLLAAPEVRRAATVAAYVAVGSEPGTGPLLAGLHAAGKRVILPVLLPDGDLEWAVHTGDADLRPARRGLLEPAGPTLGPDAIATADVVLVPGLAVSSAGARLGRGGGSYDRALSRVPVGTFTCVLLHHDDEVGVDVPVEPHDRSVAAAATPTRLVRFESGFEARPPHGG